LLGQLPGLLQPWGIVALTLVALGLYLLARAWHRRHTTRPALHLDVAALSLLALLTGGFFWRPLTESGVWMPAGGGDLTALYYPTYSYTAQQIKAGTLPLWNPHLFGGMPLAADIQSGLFYPINWILYLFLDVDYSTLEWLLIAHYWLASAFTYVFLRDVGISRLGAIAGGVVFAFCGFMVAHLGHLPMVLVATWMPLVLFTFRRSLLSTTLTGWAMSIATGLLMAVALLAGHVQIFAYGLLAAALLWLYLLIRHRPDSWRAAVPWILKGALALAVAISIGAAQLLPSLELSNQSSRASVSYEEASEFPAQPITLLNLLLPRVYGSSPTTYNFGAWQTTENWGYCGVVTLALAAAALTLRRRPSYELNNTNNLSDANEPENSKIQNLKSKIAILGFFALLVALAFVIMVGDLSIVGAWIYKFLPGFNKLRDAGRALVLLGLGLAGLAGYGLDALLASLRGPDMARRNALWWLVGLSGVLVIALFGVMPALYKEILLGGGAEYGRLPGAINDLGMLVLWLGLLAGIGWFAYRGQISAKLAGPLILLLLVLDLFSPNSRFNPTTTNILAGYERYNTLSILEDATVDGVTTGVPMRINSDTDVQDIWQPSTAMLYGTLYDAGGAFNPLQLERYNTLWEVAKLNPNTPLYDLTGVAFDVISSTTQYGDAQKWEHIAKYEDLNIYQNKNAIPRLFLVHESRIESDPTRLIEVIRRFDVDPRHTVVLENGTPEESTLMGTAEALIKGLPTEESVRATRYSPNAVDIVVKATAPGWVVLTDAWHPGWKATLNGTSVPIEPAYHAYRAIKVDRGEHTISMVFRPDTWVWGRLISLLALGTTLLALTSLLFFTRREHNRRAPRQVEREP